MAIDAIGVEDRGTRLASDVGFALGFARIPLNTASILCPAALLVLFAVVIVAVFIASSLFGRYLLLSGR